MAKPVSLIQLDLAGCKVDMDAGSFFFVQESGLSPNFMTQYPGRFTYPEVKGAPMVYASYLLYLEKFKSSILLWVMLSDQKALEEFNAFCKVNELLPNYWVGAAPTGFPWEKVRPEHFETDQFVQLAWNRSQDTENII